MGRNSKRRAVYWIGLRSIACLLRKESFNSWSRKEAFINAVLSASLFPLDESEVTLTDDDAAFLSPIRESKEACYRRFPYT